MNETEENVINNSDRLGEVFESPREILSHNLKKFLYDIIEPVRVMSSVFIVFTIFLIINQILFSIFKWLSQDIINRITYVAWVLDGVQIFSILVISIYFIYTLVYSLRTQWRIASSIEKRAELHG